jgi:hypothetical protein
VSQQAGETTEKFPCRGWMARYPQISVDKFVDYLGIAPLTVDAAAPKSVAIKK